MTLLAALALLGAAHGPLAAAAAELGGSSTASAQHRAPRRKLLRLRLGELQAMGASTQASLGRALRTEGAVLLTDIPGFTSASRSALDSMGDCLGSFATRRGGNDASGPVRSTLAGGKAERWTVAAQTEGGAQGPLPAWVAEACPGLEAATSSLRGLVGLLLSLFARSADAASVAISASAPLAHAVGPPSLRAGSGGGALHRVSAPEPQGPSLEDVVRRGNHLEHFHRYLQAAAAGTARPFGGSQPAALRMHTDAGMLQALTVRWRRALASSQLGDGGNLGADAHADLLGLEVQLPGGETVATDADTGGTPGEAAGSSGAPAEEAGLLILVGQGAEEWLPHQRLRAAPHALALGGGPEFERLVYGVMILPPDDWPIHGTAANATFGEWWRRAQQAVSVQVSGHADNDEGEGQSSAIGCLSMRRLQRRLEDQARACPSGSVYCWMQCQTVPADLPCDQSAAMCMSETTGDICTERGPGHTHDASCTPTCPTSNDLVVEVQGAGEGMDVVEGLDCNGVYKADDLVGGKHSYLKVVVQPAGAALEGVRAMIRWDEGYKRWELFAEGYRNSSVLYYNEANSRAPPTGGWETYAGDLPAPRLRYVGVSGSSGLLSRQGTGFCNGVLTDMHMLGFIWSGEEDPCLILLFPGWELTDATKFWLAAAGVVLAGIFAEFLVAVRRWQDAAVKKTGSSLLRRLRVPQRLALYGVTRTVGYLIMLVSMTYSIELFIALIAGLTIGHGLFNLSAPPGEDVTPCCQAGGGSKSPSDSQSSPVSGGSSLSVLPELVDGQLRLHVAGMTCGSCERTVRQAAEAVPGVAGVAGVSAGTGVLKVEIASGSAVEETAERLRNAVEEVGFSVKLQDQVSVDPKSESKRSSCASKFCGLLGKA